MQSIESSSSAPQRGLGTKLTITVMVLVLLVAIVFAANENDVIGWLVVIISGAWLILAIATLIWARKTAGAVTDQAKALNANLAGRGQTVQVTDGTDPMRDTKLDHSFKIVEVQKRVIITELDKGSQADTEMIYRALDTIEMTAHNARDMINPNRHEKKNDDKNSDGKNGKNDGKNDDAETIEGEVL